MKHVSRLLASFLSTALAIAQQATSQAGITKRTTPEQTAAQPGESQPKDPVLEGQILRMREQMTKGRQVRSHVRVTINLKNGNKIKGVVKDGRLVERDDGLRFVQAEALEPGAGIRLWYFNKSSSYVFLPFEAIATYSVQEKLTAEQVQAIEAQMREDERRRAELDKLNHLKGADGQDATGPGAAATPPVTGAPADAQKPPPVGPEAAATSPGAAPVPGKLSAEQQKAFALLQEFPPEAGWSAQRRDEIARKLPVLHVNPTEAEKHFLEVFADWQKACDMFGTKAAPAPGTSTGTPSQGDGSTAGDSKKRGRKK